MNIPVSQAASHVLCRHPALRRHTLTRVMGVLNFWKNGAGLDSHEIAGRLGVPEADVCLIIRTDRDRRLRRHSDAA